MLGEWPSREFPDLTQDNHSITSDPTRRYNCIAWAAGDAARKWWPDSRNIGWWPPTATRAETVEAFIEAFGTLGFALCIDDSDGSVQDGVEKIAIFGIKESGRVTPTHAALQLESGRWTSKLGDFEDISHSPVDAVAGPLYGDVVCYLVRPRNPQHRHSANLLDPPSAKIQRTSWR